MAATLSRTVLAAVAFAFAGAVSAPPTLAGQDDAQIKKGEQVYKAQKCSTCHSIAGKGSKKGPLDGVGTKLTADEIREWIVNPTEMTKKTESKTKPPMPNKYAKLPAGDIDALVAYLASLK
jgi:mono/diheme cytochrome c family protein